MASLLESRHVQRELRFAGPIQAGASGLGARRIQEWLTYHRNSTAVDGDFGPATRQCVQRFQRDRGLEETGVVDEATWAALVEPMAAAVSSITPSAGETLPDVVLRCAELHLGQHPVEIGGDNLGPWVRLYMSGNEGAEWYWCAGFVSFVLRQASESLGVEMPIPGSFSCDLLASQAQARQLFVTGESVARDDVLWDDLGAAQIFLVRRTTKDWTHTGFSHGGHAETFETIEGNTNDEGSRNGYEVCGRTRSVPKKDFIRLVG